MFNIIVDFPESAGALQDLKVRMNLTVNKSILFYLVHRSAWRVSINVQTLCTRYGERTLCFIVIHRSPVTSLIMIFRIDKRLLHPGADTKVILGQYVSTIKCLRIIDPPGVLLFKVADPIRRYLRYVHVGLD
jgi:anaphase-promoting complex subunit 2